jgi:hypothetical protein
MNVAYAVAVALLDGEVLIDQFSDKRINSGVRLELYRSRRSSSG